MCKRYLLNCRFAKLFFLRKGNSARMLLTWTAWQQNKPTKKLSICDGNQQQRKRKCTFDVLLTYLPKRNETNAKILDLRTASRSGLVLQPSWLNKASGDLFFLPQTFWKKSYPYEHSCFFYFLSKHKDLFKNEMQNVSVNLKKTEGQSLSNNLKKDTRRSEMRLEV